MSIAAVRIVGIHGARNVGMAALEWIAAARTASVLRRVAVSGLAILVAACAGPLPPTPASTAASPSPRMATASPSAVPSASAAADWTALRWTAPALTAPYETISDVVAWDGGYVAVGSFQNAKGGNQAEAWSSSDWRTWTRTMLDVPAVGDSTLGRLVEVGGRLVAIGASGEPKCTGPAGEGQVCDPTPLAIWTSTDGQRWQHPVTSATLAGVAIDAVASNGSLLILAGNTGWDKPGIWTSSDGTTWQRVTLPAASFAHAHFVALATVPGGFVLTGSTGGREPTCCVSGDSGTTSAAWFSQDGSAWQTAVVDGATGTPGDQIGQVFVGRTGLVAWAGRDASFGWASPDGRRWSALPKPSGYPVIPRASDGSRIIGDSYTTGGLEAFWISSDGTAWRALGSAGEVNQMPFWDSTGGATADAEFLFPNGLGLVGQNGTDRFPLWFAEGASGS